LDSVPYKAQQEPPEVITDSESVGRIPDANTNPDSTRFMHPPSIEEAKSALKDLKKILGHRIIPEQVIRTLTLTYSSATGLRP
jgi:hypothetical protein